MEDLANILYFYMIEVIYFISRKRFNMTDETRGQEASQFLHKKNRRPEKIFLFYFIIIRMVLIIPAGTYTILIIVYGY
jgi:hypothetical protein